MFLSQDWRGNNVLMVAVASRSRGVLEVTLGSVLRSLSDEQRSELITSRSLGANNLFKIAIHSDADILEIVLKFVEEHLASHQVSGFWDSEFSAWLLQEDEAPNLRKISACLEHSSIPSSLALISISRKFSLESLKTCFLRAVASAGNPFIPGMTLSVALAGALDKAPEGERRMLTSLRGHVNALLLEILERLPQTVRGFEGQMKGCAAMLEPEESMENHRGRPGPLRMAFQERLQMEIFCKVPIVMDFVSRRFTRGLPDLRDTGSILSDKNELEVLASGYDGGGDGSPILEGGTADVTTGTAYSPIFVDLFRRQHGRVLFGEGNLLNSLSSAPALLQGARFDIPGLSVLPGAQFIAAGLASKPKTYYKVPAMRMSLDFVVYSALLVVYSAVILFPEKEKVTSGEGLLAFYIVAAAMMEVQEMRRGLRDYMGDHWNVLDVSGLMLLTAGFLLRVADPTNELGQGLYASSAPLVFSRVLFFAQILPSQGPLIQVISSMMAELLQFLVVMLVVILGFAMSFYSLLRGNTSYDDIWLLLFKAMLGEVGFFDELDVAGDSDDDRNSDVRRSVGTVLFVMYLVVMAVMLLNLLIAVLSTSHSRVQENVDREFKVSKAKLIQHYRWIVAGDILPPPFNLVQLMASTTSSVVEYLSKGKARPFTRRTVGQVVFWSMLCPLGAFGGAMLWVVSTPWAPVVWRTYFLKSCADRPAEIKGLSATAMAFRYVIVCLWCILGAPVWLVGLWISHPFVTFWLWIWPRSRTPTALAGPLVPRIKRPDFNVDDMLKRAADRVSADDLRRHLDDPMSDPTVRHDEIKRGATVEHLKFLRDRLEKTIDFKLESVSATIEARIAASNAEMNVEAIEAAVLKSEKRMLKAIEEIVNRTHRTTNIPDKKGVE